LSGVEDLARLQIEGPRLRKGTEDTGVELGEMEQSSFECTLGDGDPRDF
jgi:hypothetical protein